MIDLDESIRLISLQFHLNALASVPELFRKREREASERDGRTVYGSGLLVIQQEKRCSLDYFPEELLASGYELVDAFFQKRTSGYAVRVTFCRHAAAKPSDDFLWDRGPILEELFAFCKTSLWQTRAFLNPFYENGKEVARVRSVDINLNERTPLVDADGQPAREWEKDANGNKVGDAPVPIRPRFRLCVMHGNVELVRP